MAYQVLARKWRPQTFADVVGQDHIGRTLKNAIIQNRIGHAYLFVGSRGIGKTTTARIFAKALNCANNVNGEPCGECESCREIAAGTSMDVIEIDGASHNKVEDIRDIRENVQYMPLHGRFKIYIIDEVHMLTSQAWNALLKTLEEPPAHVKFLFATTEPHKVLPTIISRCQRFDLKRISVPLIAHRLRQIADGEGIKVEDNALNAIARAADGGMRDAQSILDQIIAFCGGTGEGEIIREQDVIDVFGLASGVELKEIAAGIFTNDINRSLLVLQKLSDSGRDLERLFGDLIGYVRNIMVAGLVKDPSQILEVSDSELADLGQLGKALDSKLVQRVLQGLVAQEWNFRSALNKRIYFEAVLARVILDAHSVQLDDIIRQLNILNGTMPQLQTPVVKENPFGAAPIVTGSGAVPASAAPASMPPAAAAPVAAPAPAPMASAPMAPAPAPVAAPAPAPMAPAPMAPAAAAPVAAPAPAPMASAPMSPAAAAPVATPAPAPMAPAPMSAVPAAPPSGGAVSGSSFRPAPLEQASHDTTGATSFRPSPVGAPSVVSMPMSSPSSSGGGCVPSQDQPPADFYNTLEEDEGGELDENGQPIQVLPNLPLAPSPAPSTTIDEDLHKGMRRPTLDEFEELNRVPFVQRVKEIFHSSVVDARLKE